MELPDQLPLGVTEAQFCWGLGETGTVLRAGLRSLTVTSGAGSSFAVGLSCGWSEVCPVPGLYPLDAGRSSLPAPSCDDPGLQTCLRGERIPRVEKHLRVTPLEGRGHGGMQGGAEQACRCECVKHRACSDISIY